MARVPRVQRGERPRAERTRPADPAEHAVDRAALGFLLACLFVSGAASLALEAVWMRSLRLVFGSTTLATSTVLVAYMVGLGIGGWLGGQIAQRFARPLAVYGLLEVLVGAYALAVPWLTAVAARWLQAWLADADFWLASWLRFLASAAVLSVPTIAMGATLPVAVQAASAATRGAGRTTALLYAANTCGAVAGVFAATFVLLPSLGLRWSNATAAALDVALGLSAIVVSSWLPLRQRAAVVPRSDSARASPLPSRRAGAIPLLAYGIVGCTALGYQVCWTRALASVFGSSTYAFGTVLGAFLVGIALGSFAVRTFVDRWRAPAFVAALGMLALGVATVVTMRALYALPGWFPWSFWKLGGTYAAAMWSSVLLATAALLLPTLVLGALFPLLVRVVTDQGWGISRSIGSVYLANTLGSALGAFAAGFLLLPHLGLERSVALLVTLDVAAAIALAVWQRERGTRHRAALVGAAAVLVAVVWLGGMRGDPAALARGVFRFPLTEIDVGVRPVALTGPLEGEMLYFRDGWNATVSVHRILGELSLRVNGKADASTHGDLATQVLLGHLGFLFHPHAETIAIVGLASGITVGSATLYPARRIDVIEIEPAMLEAQRLFAAFNHLPLEQPQVRVVLDDARAYLAARTSVYDVIVSEPSNPWMAGAANLFTREFFQIARGALRPGGKLVQWVQLYAMPEAAVAAVLRALGESFPYVYGFAPSHGDTDLLLVGSTEPIAADAWPQWEQLPAAARKDLVRAEVFDTDDLRALLYLVPPSVQRWGGQAPRPNTDDNMLVEFTGARALYTEPTGPANWEHIDAEAPAVLSYWSPALGTPHDAGMGELALAHLRRDSTAIVRAWMQLGQSAKVSPWMQAAALQLELEEQETDPHALERAARQLGDLVSQAPQSFGLRYLLAKTEYERQEHGRALAHLEVGLAVRPDDLRLRRLRLRVFLALGRHREAWEEARALLATPLRQRDLNLYWDAAQAAAALGLHENVVDLVRHYLEFYPDSPEQWLALADAWEQVGKKDLAAKARASAEQAKRNFVLTLHMQARRLALAGATEDALAQLRNVLLLAPDLAAAKLDLQRLQNGQQLQW